jgi:hypothetical protein
LNGPGGLTYVELYQLEAVMPSTTSSSSVYTYAALSTQSPSGPTIVPNVIAPGGYNYVAQGCYQDQLGQAYPLASPYVDGSVTTIERCISDCSTIGNFIFAGIELGECFCSNAIYSGALAQGQCNTPCTGDSSESCGSNQHIIVYKESTIFQIHCTCALIN